MITRGTIERTAQQISVKDVRPPAGALYGDPHPIVWATETVLRDGWEVTAYRRELARSDVGGAIVVAYVEQVAEPGAEPELVIDVSGTVRSPVGRLFEFEKESAYDCTGEVLWKAGREAEAFQVDRAGRRVRPGILEVLADALGTTNDADLASRLQVDPFSITLARHGFTPWRNNMWINLTDALTQVGLAKNRGHADKLAVTPGIKR